MRMKTFLLGSAAALGVGGVAQAADLTPMYSEPVDYVRVCDAFGAGYFYIPGTDTCLRLGGYVRLQVETGDPSFNVSNVGGSNFDHYQDWRFKSRAHLDLDAASQTDWGPLIGHMEFEANFGAGDGDVNWQEPSTAFVSLGPFTAGIYQSNFDTGGSFTSAYQLDDGFGQGFTDDKILQVQLSWAFNGFGIILAAEDPNKRIDDWNEFSSEQGSVPDLVAALTGSWGNLDAKIAFLYRDTSPDSTYGVQGNVQATNFFGSLDLLVAGYWISKGTFGQVGPDFPFTFPEAGYTPLQGDVWGAQASVRWDWTSMLKSAVTAQYDDYSDAGGIDGWAFAFNTDFTPVDEFLIRGAVRYYEYNDDWNALIEFRRSFGG